MIDRTFQQLQKYETGKNRISASVLWELAQVLDVPVSFFFNGHATAPDRAPNMILESETLALVRAFYRIPTKHLRASIIHLIRMIARGNVPALPLDDA